LLEQVEHLQELYQFQAYSWYWFYSWWRYRSNHAAALTTAFEAYIAALEMLFVHNNGSHPHPKRRTHQEEVLATCLSQKN